MRAIISNANDGMVVEDFYTGVKPSEILKQISSKGYIIYDYEIKKDILKVNVEVIKYCGACNRKIDYSETCYTLDNQDEICSECHELYLGNCEEEYYE